MQQTIDQTTIECIQGDITKQPDISIIVNAANKQLKGGGGADGAIHRAAGPELLKASRALGPIDTGQAVITPAFGLPNTWVIHCAGPVYSKNPAVPEQLAACYSNALELAEHKQAQSIAFPAISAGIYGYPLDQAARIAINTVAAYARQQNCLELARFVLFSAEALAAFETALSGLT